MSDKSKSPQIVRAIEGDSKKPKRLYNNSSSSQWARILKYLETNQGLSTMQARDVLGILHPCGRIMELRDMGYKIETVKIYAPDNNRVTHRIGMYIFHGIDWKVLEKKLSKRMGAKEFDAQTVDQRYALLKAEIAKRHLTPEQYEAAIKSLCTFLDY